jgi:hypothetical protein
MHETETGQIEVRHNWQPQWLVDIGHGCQCGIMVDDHCYIVLCQDWEGNWTPSKHIPINVAKFLGKIANEDN